MLELTPNLNMNSKKALYVQLYEYIKKEIKDGTIPAFTKLPAKRKLASYLQVSKNTVEAAYEQLLAEGYIESISRKGYFVYHNSNNDFQPAKVVKKMHICKNNRIKY